MNAKIRKVAPNHSSSLNGNVDIRNGQHEQGRLLGAGGAQHFQVGRVAVKDPVPELAHEVDLLLIVVQRSEMDIEHRHVACHDLTDAPSPAMMTRGSPWSSGIPSNSFSSPL